MNFFFAIDMISYTILIFIIYATFSTIFLVLASLEMSYWNIIRIILSVSALLYIVAVSLLLYWTWHNKKDNLRDRWKGLLGYTCTEILLLVIFLLFVFLPFIFCFLQKPNIIEFYFLALIGYLLLLFLWYLVPIGTMIPVTHYLKLLEFHHSYVQTENRPISTNFNNNPHIDKPQNNNSENISINNVSSKTNSLLTISLFLIGLLTLIVGMRHKKQ